MEQICTLQSLSLEKARLKACGPLGHVGSNPTPGATTINGNIIEMRVEPMHACLS